MIDRRQLLSVGGLLGALAPTGTEATAYGAGQMSDRAAADVVAALRNISNAVSSVAAHESFDAIIPVRNRQVDFLKANSKFPDFIEVGSDVWQNVYDWHVRYQQPNAVGRTPEGRYTILLLATNVVMRPDMAASYIGVGYDNR